MQEPNCLSKEGSMRRCLFSRELQDWWCLLRCRKEVLILRPFNLKVVLQKPLTRARQQVHDCGIVGAVVCTFVSLPWEILVSRQQKGSWLRWISDGILYRQLSLVASHQSFRISTPNYKAGCTISLPVIMSRYVTASKDHVLVVYICFLSISNLYRTLCLSNHCPFP